MSFGKRYDVSNYNVRYRRDPPLKRTNENACDQCKSKPWSVKPYTDVNGQEVNGKNWDESLQPELKLCVGCFQALDAVLCPWNQ